MTAPSQPPAPARRFLAVVLPYLSADRLRAERPAAGGEEAAPPLAFTERVGGALRLVGLSVEAADAGLATGLTLADARARLPDLVAVPADPVADAVFLDRLADRLGRFTPLVALDPPDGILLDLSGVAHLFGGEARLLKAIDHQVATAAARARLATGPTPEAARALARYQQRPGPSEEAALARLPVVALELEGEALEALGQAGLKTLGQVAALPRAPLAARFGPEVPARLDRLLGRVDSRLTPRRPLPPIHLVERFAEPIARTEDVEAALLLLAERAARRLGQRGKGGRLFEAFLDRADGAVRALAVESPRPLAEGRAIARLFFERIEGLADPLDPGFGFDSLRLEVRCLEPLAPAQLALEADAVAADEAVDSLVGRLSARHGREQLRRPLPADTHIPEQALLDLPAVEAAPPRRWPELGASGPPTRPLHLFDPPQPVAVMALLPDGPPLRFRWRRTLHDVVRYEGPERIASEWWRRPPGKPGLTRDYWRVEDARGRRFWLFRHGLGGTERANPRWYLHGLFA